MRNGTRWLVGLLVMAALAACGAKEEKGVCITKFSKDSAEQCRLDTARDLCKTLGEPTSSLPDQSSRFEPVTKEDRDRWENVKTTGGDITALTCRRLGFMHCSQASGMCTIR